ncbi:hypothetical protein I5H08_gp018 [Mycobacterium phage Yuna]|uniref:Uncharacterized protein n=1 Tax=Mycobacterium phage Yuna TaxID=2599885 RepID=A0A5J6TIA7_9CAUD|nr:hypothetical protein I5H08_gp018 [Mycobacterium phage Yuna]QFG09469.1 hypothetical protein PBI_YUNA_87 [Mycobacterium phage Yuna]
MRGLIERWLRRRGYVPVRKVLHGEIVWRAGEPVWVSLDVPGGQRVVGYVESPLSRLTWGGNPLIVEAIEG